MRVLSVTLVPSSATWSRIFCSSTTAALESAGVVRTLITQNVDLLHTVEGKRVEAPALTAQLLMHLGEDDEFIDKPAQQAIVDALAGKPKMIAALERLAQHYGLRAAERRGA